MAAFVASSEARSRFAELLRSAEAGERVTVTRNGEPVAQIVPIRPRTGGFMQGRVVEHDPDWWKPDDELGAEFGVE